MKKIHSLFLWLGVGLFFVNVSIHSLVPPPPALQAPLPGLTPSPTLGNLPGITSAVQPKPAVQTSPTVLPGLTPLPTPGVLPGITPVLSPTPVPVQNQTTFPGLTQPTPLPPPVAGSLPGVTPVLPLPAPVQTQTQVLTSSPVLTLPAITPITPVPAVSVQPVTSVLPEVSSQSSVQEEPVKAVESVALQAFPEGSRVVLLFIGQGGKDTRLLKVTRGIYVSPTGKDPFDPKCQFVVMRKENWVGFKSDYLKGKTLQSDPTNFVVHFPNSDFSDDNHKAAHWSVQFINPRDASSIVRLQNRATQGFLNFPYEPWAENLAWTAFKEKTPATVAGELARLKIVKVTELPKETAKAIGGKDYVYTPRLHKKLTPIYSDGWKFETPGSGYVIFDTYTKKNIVVGISTVAENLTDNMYYLVIGDEKGISSTIRKQIGGPIFYKQSLKGIPVVESMKQKGKKSIASYWIKIDAGKISYGTGRVIDQNMILEWKDPDKPLKVQFVGFAGGDVKVDFRNIEIGGKEKLASTLVLPNGFKQEAGTLKRVAVGSRKGVLEIWGIGVDGTLWRWKAGSMASNPWEQQKVILNDGSVLTSLNDLSLSSRGDLFVISQGKAYKYDWDKIRWNEIDTGMQRVQLVAISGHENNLWTIGSDGVAYQFVKQTWQKRSDPDSALRIVVSPDNEVFVLNKAKKIFRYKGNSRWEKIPSKASFNELFTINKELLLAIDRQQNLWQFTSTSGWAPVAGENKQRATGFTHGSGNAAGTIVLVGSQGNLYKIRNDGVPEKKISQMMAQKAPALASVAKKIAARKKKVKGKVRKLSKKRAGTLKAPMKKKKAKKKKVVKKKRKKKQEKKAS